MGCNQRDVCMIRSLRRHGAADGVPGLICVNRCSTGPVMLYFYTSISTCGSHAAFQSMDMN